MLLVPVEEILLGVVKVLMEDLLQFVAKQMRHVVLQAVILDLELLVEPVTVVLFQVGVFGDLLLIRMILRFVELLVMHEFQYLVM